MADHRMIIAIVLSAFLIAFLLPAVVGNIGEPHSATYTQEDGENVTLAPNLHANMTYADGLSADYTITVRGNSTTTNVSGGDSETVTVDGVNVTITADQVNQGSATSTYEWPQTYGWGMGASDMWPLIPLIIVAGAFLIFAKIMLGAV